ncbi:Panacea domain-containing protein [Pseudomonas sp. JQ36]
MNHLQNLIAYLCVMYPYPSELSKARLTKLVYLADWFSSVQSGQQMTNIRWLFNHYGPYVDDVVDSVRNRGDFLIANEINNYGSDKQTVRFTGNPQLIRVATQDRAILDWLINRTQHMYFNDFIDFVYSTYPVSHSERYSNFDLVQLAEEYRNNN